VATSSRLPRSERVGRHRRHRRHRWNPRSPRLCRSEDNACSTCEAVNGSSGALFSTWRSVSVSASSRRWAPEKLRVEVTRVSTVCGRFSNVR